MTECGESIGKEAARLEFFFFLIVGYVKRAASFP
jgi:hypothetical protein